MSWQTFFRLRPSLVFVAGFGCLTFGLGLGYDKIVQELAKSAKAEFWALLLPPTIVVAIGTGSLKSVQGMVSKEIEIEAERQSAEARIQAERQSAEIKQEAIKYCHDRYLDDINNLKAEICSLSIPQESLEKIQKSFSRIDSTDRKLEADFVSFRAITSWLDIQGNRLILLNKAMTAVSMLHISEPYRMLFEQDMRECIHWLRYSIHELRACEVQPQRQASAILKQMPQGAEAYRLALTAIEEHPEFRQLTTPVPFVNELISHLKSEISQVPQHKVLAA